MLTPTEREEMRRRCEKALRPIADPIKAATVRYCSAHDIPLLLEHVEAQDKELARLREMVRVLESNSVASIRDKTWAIQYSPVCPSKVCIRFPNPRLDFKPLGKSKDTIGYGETVAEALANLQTPEQTLKCEGGGE